GGTWKYYFGFGENISIKLFVYNSNYIPQEVNITKVEMSEDGDSCWSEYCKIYANYSYKVNGTGGTGINGNGTFRIINSGTWKRGQHSIKATIQGSAGSAVIKTGYVHVRDISLPNITVVSPQNGELINTTSFLSNVTANEDVTCSAVMWNYDAFSQSYCGAGNITSGACNNTRFNGSTYYSEIILTSYTPQKVHAHNIGVTGLTNQDYSIRTQCNDVDWNRAETYVTFTLNISLATAPVRVNLSSPANTTTVNSSTTTFKYNVTGPSSSTANCSVYVNVSNIWRVNVSNNVSLANVTNISTVNVAGFNNGTYVWNTYCSQTTNATNNAWAAANWTFTVANNVTTAISLVNVTLSSPANGATVNTSPVNFTYNLRGAGSANCSLYTNTTSSWLLNQTSNNIGNGSRSFSSSNIANGNYIWNVNCINSTNSAYEDWGDSNFTFNFINNVTLVPVTANLSSPINNSVQNSSPITFTYNASGPSAGMTCALWSNSTGVWKANVTNSSATPGQQTANHSFVNGTYVWNSRCEDNGNSSNYAFGALNYTLTVVNISNSTSTSNLTVNLSSPSNASTTSTNMIPIYNVSGPSSLNCSVWGNFTGTWLANITNNSMSPGTVNAGTLFISTGNYIWNTRCVDATDSSAFAWAPYNWTFTRNS
ncbi:MAG: hypothetical protein AABX60_03815, partial [Nanoarchaeota archaeon]